MTDQDCGTPGGTLEISSRVWYERSATRRATKTASVPAWISSVADLATLKAAAANEPVHNPSAKVSRDVGY